MNAKDDKTCKECPVNDVCIQYLLKLTCPIKTKKPEKENKHGRL